MPSKLSIRFPCWGYLKTIGRKWQNLCHACRKHPNLGYNTTVCSNPPPPQH
ncbi:hypothetical protein EIKCOROL_00408 [Eikenella corrodens ATCC 23834]|uniref:Uncharacterized protein n=1 Tax=Eikenella corrodens ATCC 23834 TaxID=546274 RepID=C0DST5_EIKCO|nr:hypothetical protein EIKCOROL_00408 [Eikenella corrodens ATCC 23834]